MLRPEIASTQGAAVDGYIVAFNRPSLTTASGAVATLAVAVAGSPEEAMKFAFVSDRRIVDRGPHVMARARSMGVSDNAAAFVVA